MTLDQAAGREEKSRPSEVPKELLSVACVIHSLSGGGAERVMAGLSSRLVHRGHRVSLITYQDEARDRHSVDERVARVPLNLESENRWPFSKLKRVRKRLSALATAVSDINPDVVMSFCDRNNIDTLLALRRTAVPVVVSERSDPSQQSLGWYWEWQRRRTYPRAATVVALTESSAKYLRKTSDRVVVIPSAVDQPPLLSDRLGSVQNKTIVSVGRLEWEKGFDRLVHAFAIATENEDAWNLIIYGEGSRRAELEKLAIELGVQNRVAFPGWERPIWGPLSKATMFSLPSRYEGFPSALLEAMALGVPSISVDCESGPRAIVKHGENGLLVDPTVEGLAEGIRKYILDPESRERIGMAGREVASRFGWDQMTKAYEDILIQATLESR